MQLSTFECERLEAEATRLLIEAGFSNTAALITASNLISAEQDGVISHGLSLLPVYLEEAGRGTIRLDAKLTWREKGATRLVGDGGLGPGHAVLAEALRVTADHARVHGDCLLWLSGLSHTGRLSNFTERVLDEGLCCLLTVTSVAIKSLATVCPPDRATRIIGTNPVAIALRDNAGPLMSFDGSLAETTFFRLRNASRAGSSLDGMHLLNHEALPTNDPSAFMDGGAIRPLGGGPRGFGLSLALALFCRFGGNRVGRPEGTDAFALVFRPPDGADVFSDLLNDLTSMGIHVPGRDRLTKARTKLINLIPETLHALRTVGARI